MERIRPCTRGDIPAIVALRRATFRHSTRADAADLARYFESVFFENPWRDDELRPLVYLDDSGRPVGFLGVVPRPALLRGARIRVAVSTQLMAHPNVRDLVGARLTKAFLDGPQDLSLADAANDGSRAIWHVLGGRTSLVHSLRWTRVVRPWRHGGDRVVRRLAGRAVAYGMRPVWQAADRLFHGREKPGMLSAMPLGADDLDATCAAVLSGVSLRFVYAPDAARWLSDQLAMRNVPGEPRRVVLRDARDAIAGWYWYYANRGGTGEVLQLAAVPGWRADVLDHLVRDAWRLGVVALTGAVDPALLPALGACGATVTASDGPWTLFHSRRPEVVNAIEQGDCHLSRLDGEWWMSF